MSSYRVDRQLSDGLVALDHDQYRHNLWHRAVTRKDHRCARCAGKISCPEHCWRPITHNLNRMHRICIPCMNRLLRHAAEAKPPSKKETHDH